MKPNGDTHTHTPSHTPFVLGASVEISGQSVKKANSCEPLFLDRPRRVENAERDRSGTAGLSGVGRSSSPMECMGLVEMSQFGVLQRVFHVDS